MSLIGNLIGTVVSFTGLGVYEAKHTLQKANAVADARADASCREELRTLARLDNRDMWLDLHKRSFKTAVVMLKKYLDTGEDYRGNPVSINPDNAMEVAKTLRYEMYHYEEIPELADLADMFKESVRKVKVMHRIPKKWNDSKNQFSYDEAEINETVVMGTPCDPIHVIESTRKEVIGWEGVRTDASGGFKDEIDWVHRFMQLYIEESDCFYHKGLALDILKRNRSSESVGFVKDDNIDIANMEPDRFIPIDIFQTAHSDFEVGTDRRYYIDSPLAPKIHWQQDGLYRLVETFHDDRDPYAEDRYKKPAGYYPEYKSPYNNDGFKLGFGYLKDACEELINEGYLIPLDEQPFTKFEQKHPILMEDTDLRNRFRRYQRINRMLHEIGYPLFTTDELYVLFSLSDKRIANNEILAKALEILDKYPELKIDHTKIETRGFFDNEHMALFDKDQIRRENSSFSQKLYEERNKMEERRREEIRNSKTFGERFKDYMDGEGTFFAIIMIVPMIITYFFWLGIAIWMNEDFLYNAVILDYILLLILNIIPYGVFHLHRCVKYY